MNFANIFIRQQFHQFDWEMRSVFKTLLLKTTAGTANFDQKRSKFKKLLLKVLNS